MSGVGSEGYGGGGVVEEGWWEDEGSDCVVGAGGEEAGSVGGPGGLLVWVCGGNGAVPLCAFEVIGL